MSAFPAPGTIPLDRLTTLDERDRIAIFHCRSGQRTAAHAAKLAAAAACEAYIVEGGIEAWKKAGLPVASDRSQPIEIQRQVQIAAGSLVLLGVVLGLIAVAGVLRRLGVCRGGADLRRHLPAGAAWQSCWR